jgi:hypothetical protein
MLCLLSIYGEQADRTAPLKHLTGISENHKMESTLTCLREYRVYKVCQQDSNLSVMFSDSKSAIYEDMIGQQRTKVSADKPFFPFQMYQLVTLQTWQNSSLPPRGDITSGQYVSPCLLIYNLPYT